MHCQKTTLCNSCKKVFTSLCSCFSHLSKGINSPGYLFSVYLSANDQFLVYPASDACFEKPLEQPLSNPKLVIKYPECSACSAVSTGKQDSPKPALEKVAPPNMVVFYPRNSAPSEKNIALQQKLNTYPADGEFKDRKYTKQPLTCHRKSTVVCLKPAVQIIQPGHSKSTDVCLKPAVQMIQRGHSKSTDVRLKPAVQMIPKCHSKSTDYRLKPAVHTIQRCQVVSYSTGKGKELDSPSNYINKSSQNIAQKQVNVGVTGSDITTDKDAKGGKHHMSCSSQGTCKDKFTQPASLDSTHSVPQEYIGQSSDKLVTFQLHKTARYKRTEHKVTPVLLVNNKHRRNENESDLVNKGIYKEEDVMSDSANANDGVLNGLVGVRIGEDGRQNRAGTSSQCSRKSFENNFPIEEDGLEPYNILNEHNYSKGERVGDAHCQQDEWKVSYNEEYLEKEAIVSTDESTNNNLQVLELGYPDNTIDTETLEKSYVVTKDVGVSADFPEPRSNNGSMEDIAAPPARGNGNWSLKTSSDNSDRGKEVDLKLPPTGEHLICVFRRYGFKMIQRRNFYIECRFCSQKCMDNEIVNHIKTAHIKHLKCVHPTCQEYTNKFQLEFELLSRYLRDTWSPNSRLVKVTIVKGKKHRFCGFDIKPFPELRFLCSSCKKNFSRNDFIKHVADCYKLYKMDITKEFEELLEQLQKTIPVFQFGKSVPVKKHQQKLAVKKNTRLRYKDMRRMQSEHSLLKEFKYVKPDLFKTNRLQFLEEFKKYQEQRHEEWRKRRDEPVNCTVCLKKVKAYYLKAHMNYAHTSETYPCEICGGLYPSRRALNSHHRQLHTGTGTFPCSICEKTFTTSIRFRKHYKNVHQRQALFHCEVCGKSFKFLQTLNNHVLTHKDARPFSCRICEAAFKRPDTLKSHIDKVHDLKVLWVCSAPRCKAKYKTKMQLEEHILKHKGKQFLCSYCPQQLSSRRLLNVHLEKVHSVKEPVKASDIGRQENYKETDYGQDGTIKLKTLLIPEDELQEANNMIQPFRWTEDENKIFWNILDEYIKAKSQAPRAAIKKVQQELEGARTLQQIKLKFVEAKRKEAKSTGDSKGENSSRKRKHENIQQPEIPKRKGTHERRSKDGMTNDYNKVKCSDIMEPASENISAIAGAENAEPHSQAAIVEVKEELP